MGLRYAPGCLSESLRTSSLVVGSRRSARRLLRGVCYLLILKDSVWNVQKK